MKQTAIRYFGSWLGRILRVSYEASFVQNRLIVEEKAFEDDRKHGQVQDVGFERILIAKKSFNLKH